MVLLPMVLLLPTLSAAVGGEFKDEHLLRDTSHFRVAIAARAGPILGSWSHIEGGRASTLADLPLPARAVPVASAPRTKNINIFKEIKEKYLCLFKDVNAAFADPKMKARLADLGGVALPGSPAEFGKLIAEETEKWAKVVKFAGIKAD